jgi:aminopeptidase N
MTKPVYLKILLNILLIIIINVILVSCYHLGINFSKKTPKVAGKYPKFTEKDTLKGQYNRFRSCFDVHYYELSIKPDIEKQELSGNVDMYFSMLRDADTLQIDLYKNMQLQKIVCDSKELKFERKYDAVFVLFPQELKKGRNYKLSVYYSGKPQKAHRPPWEGGMVWKQDQNKKPWIAVCCENDGASLWWPCKDHLADEPDSFRMHVTLPKDLFCVSNGRLEHIEEGAENSTFTWFTSSPINNYNVTFYAGDYRHFRLPACDNDTSFKFDFYVLSYNLDKAKAHFAQTSDIFCFYQKTFGDYPWPRDGFKLVECPFEGMEHQTAIAYGHGYKNDVTYKLDYIILHETAHEWWGNSVTAKDFAEIWIHEGFATYCEALYIEARDGYQAYLDYLSFYSILIMNKYPVIHPYDVNYWNYHDTDVYMKGALVLHTLRNIIDDDSLFFDILRTFYQQHQRSFADTKSFISMVNSKTGKDYNWFFDQYLYDRTCPLLEWSFYMKNGETDSAYITYRWKNVGKEFKLPVMIKTETGNYKIYPKPDYQNMSLPYSNTIKVNYNKSYIATKRNRKISQPI